MLFFHIFVFCYQPSSLIPTQLLCKPPHCILTALSWICWLPNPKERMKWRNFIWGGVRKRENNPQNTNHAKHFLLIHCTAARLQFFSNVPFLQGREHPGQKGELAVHSLIPWRKNFCYLLRKRVRGKESTIEVSEVSATEHCWVLLAVRKDVPGRGCPRTASRQEPLSTVSRKLLLILEKYTGQVRSSQWKWRQYQSDPVCEIMGLLLVKNKRTPVCKSWHRWQTTEFHWNNPSPFQVFL